MMNDLNTSDAGNDTMPEALSTMKWIQQAKDAAVKHISTMDLPFSIPDVRELLLVWPKEVS